MKKRRRLPPIARRPLTDEEMRTVWRAMDLLTRVAMAQGRRRSARRYRLAAQTLLVLRCEGLPSEPTP